MDKINYMNLDKKNILDIIRHSKINNIKSSITYEDFKKNIINEVIRNEEITLDKNKQHDKIWTSCNLITYLYLDTEDNTYNIEIQKEQPSSGAGNTSDCSS